MHIMLLENLFYRDQFGMQITNEGNFASLKKLSESVGGVTYKVLFGIAIVCCLIAITIGGFKLAMASKGRGYEESKKGLTRVAIIMFMVISLVGLVGKIASLFAW